MIPTSLSLLPSFAVNPESKKVCFRSWILIKMEGSGEIPCKTHVSNALKNDSKWTCGVKITNPYNYHALKF